MEIINMTNQYLREMNTKMKEKEIKGSKMATCGLIHRPSLDWDLPFWPKLLYKYTNKEIIRYQGSHK